MNRVRSLLCIAALLLTVTKAWSQMPPPPPPPPPPAAAQAGTRDAIPAQVTPGTGVIAGRVQSPGETPQPIRRAIVTLTDTATNAARSVVTEDDGTFALNGLGAGRYTLIVEKPAYLTTAWGASRHGRQGKTLVLTDGQRLTGLTVTLPRGGVIGGRLTLPGGEPLADTEVRVISARLATAGGNLVDTDLARTDDRGEFRLYGLPPDTYLVAAYPRIGRGDIDPASASEFDTVVAARTRPGAPTTDKPTGASTLPLVSFTPTYFPGTAVPASATTVTVGLGEERLGIDFTVAAVHVSSVSGAVIGVDGQPQPASQLSIEAIGPPIPLGVAGTVGPGRPDADGRFTLRNIAPGSYRVMARSGGVRIGDNGNWSIDTRANTQWAVAEVTVTGQAVDGVTLQLQDGATFSGQLAAVDDETPPDSWAGVRVTVQPRRPEGPTRTFNLLTTAQSAEVDAAGSFTVRGLAPDTYDVTLTFPGPLRGWNIAGLWREGRDLRDGAMTFADGSISGVRVELSRRQSTLSGRFSTDSGAPVSDYFLVVFPDDRTIWHPGSPRMRVIRPDVDGRYTFVGLPPGTYRLAAVTDLDDDDQTRPAFLESLLESALRVTITAGAETRQDIRVR